MRHRVNKVKLGRTQSHVAALLANLACSLIEHHRITTSVAKAKALRPFVEKLITKARRGTLHDRRLVAAKLHNNSLRVKKAVQKLFTEIGPLNAQRNGGYTRIVKLGPRLTDAAPMALIELVEQPAATVVEPTPEAKPAKKAPAKKAPAKAKAEAEAPSEEKKPARKPRAKKTDKKEDAGE